MDTLKNEIPTHGLVESMPEKSQLRRVSQLVTLSPHGVQNRVQSG
jgi:hypothetical protein